MVMHARINGKINNGQIKKQNEILGKKKKCTPVSDCLESDTFISALWIKSNVISVNVAAETERRRYVDAQANFTKRGLPKKINTSAGEWMKRME